MNISACLGKGGPLFLNMELGARDSGWRRKRSCISNVRVEKWGSLQGRERMQNSMGAWTR